MTVSSKTPLLDHIKTPDDLRHLEPAQLRQVADELRRQADAFVDLVELRSKVSRDPLERPHLRELRPHASQA